nr:MAG TPA: hypothetical protein [Crassvirales sp.]
MGLLPLPKLLKLIRGINVLTIKSWKNNFSTS